MARHGAFGQAGDGGELAAARPALAGLVGEPDEALQREVQMPANGAVQVEADGDIGEQKGLRGCGATRLETRCPERTSPVARIGLAKIGEFGEDTDRQIISSRLRPDMQTRLSRRVFAYGFWVAGLAEIGTVRAA